MHLLCVIGGVARTNYMWLPGWLAFNTSLQEKTLQATKQEFYKKYERDPTTSEEDMDELDRIMIKHISDLVPAKGIRSLLRAVTKVKLSPRNNVLELGINIDKNFEDGFTDSSK